MPPKQTSFQRFAFSTRLKTIPYMVANGTIRFSGPGFCSRLKISSSSIGINNFDLVFTKGYPSVPHIMSGRETLPMYGLAFFLLLTNLPGVEGIFVQGTCDWICTAGPHIDERSRSMLTGGRLFKFTVLYEEQVQDECANQTDATNSSATASLWLKMAAGGKPRQTFQGRLHLVTQTILEEIFNGQFALGANQKINISCVFNSTSTGKSALNYSSRQLTFQNLTSVLYFVEYVANYTKPSAAFLILLRTEQNTSLSVGATSTSGSLSSARSAKDNEMSFTDGWFAVAIIIWIVIILYFPAIFILFRPSEIKLKIPQRTREVQEGQRTPVKGRTPVHHEASGESDTQPHQGDFTPSPRNIDSADSYEGSEGPKGAGGNSPSSTMPPTKTNQRTDSREKFPVQVSSDNDETFEDHGSGATPGSPAAETSRQDQDSEKTRLKSITCSHRDGATSENFSPISNRSKSWPPSRGRVNMPKAELARNNSPVVKIKNPSNQDYVNTRSCSHGDGAISENVSPSINRSKSWPPSHGRVNMPKAKVAHSNSPVVETENPSNQDSGNTRSSRRGISKFFSSCFRGQRQKHMPKTHAENTHDDTPGQEPHGTDTGCSHSNGSINSTTCIINIEESSPTNEEVQQPESDVQSHHEEEDEDEYALAIIIGKTYPVGFGSWIGKKLFSTTHERNIAWNFLKLVFLFFALPLLFFLILGDVFLVLLRKLHSRLSDHFPFAFLTPSLGYGFIDNHPVVQVLIVLSALAYFTRLCFLCFLSSSTVEASWRSCSFHRMHAICNLLQYFPSRLPSILKPCEKCCHPAPSECEKFLDLPENILHNLEKQPDIFIKYWDSFYKVWLDVREKKSFIQIVKGIFFPLAIIVSVIVDILCTSPLVCLCHWRLWMLTERFKNKFKQSSFILPVLEFLLMVLSLVWVTIFSLLYTIPLGVALVGLIKVLGNHTNEVLPQVTITVLVVHYFWSCYRSFRTPYRYVAKFLASRYQKKYNEQENSSGVNALIHYKQGDLKVIPKELFEDGCKEFKLSKKNNVAWLFVQLVGTLSAFPFIFPILVSDDASDPSTTTPIVTFLAVAYVLIDKAISGEEFQISQDQADEVVNDYIARKQRDSS